MVNDTEGAVPGRRFTTAPDQLHDPSEGAISEIVHLDAGAGAAGVVRAEVSERAMSLPVD